jgi:DNA-binding IclR family transcriptional regulator
MMFPGRFSTPPSPALDAVALRLLGEIVEAARDGRATHLEELCAAIGVRKPDCRRALTTLHRQGFVDVLRMRPTLSGFAVGSAVRAGAMKALRGLAPAAALDEEETFGPPSERPPSMTRRAA